MTSEKRIPESLVEKLAGRLIFINASDLTAIAKGLPYKPRFDADYIARLRAGGVTAIHAAAAVSLTESVMTAPKRIGSFLKVIDQYPDDLLLVEKAEDIPKARREGKIGVIMHFHSPAAIEDDVQLLAVYHRLGLRVMQLTYQGKSLLGDGCGESSPGGVSSLGRKAIEEMNRLKILIDLAHAGHRTFMEALEFSKATVICSHGCARGLRDIRRNVGDDQIQALARKGGVFGIMAKPKALTARAETEGAGLEDFLDHVDYVIRLVGADYVGVGLENAYGVDMDDRRAAAAEIAARLHRPDEEGPLPKDLRLDRYSARGVDDVTTVKRNLIRGLLERGHPEPEIARILGENFLRVYREVWNG